MSLALLFPGQGVQHPDMLPWLQAEPAAAPVLAQLSTLLGHDWRSHAADEAWACGNRVAQTLITGLSQAAWSVLKPHLPRPVAVAGYSVGELAALCAAEVVDADAGLALAGLRAAAMDRCATGTAQGLVAVTGAGEAQIDALCQRFGITVAIRIGTQRCVLGGMHSDLFAAVASLAGTQADTTWLRIGVASHTPLMAAAADALRAATAPLPWQGSSCLVVSNVDGQGHRSVSALKQRLCEQVCQPVRWDLCMQTLAQRQPRCVLEVGPGSSLSRMWAAAHPDVPSRSVDEFRSAAAVVQWVLGHTTGRG